MRQIFRRGSTPSSSRRIQLKNVQSSLIRILRFGRPVVLRSGVSTSVIAERIDAGETVEIWQRITTLTLSEIEQAALYERAA